MRQRKPISQYHPWLYFASIWTRRAVRYFQWNLSNHKYASEIQQEILPFRIKKHSSLLIRKLGDTDMQLQINKVENLKIAIQNIHGITIHPGETFSFCKLVGLPTKKKGYLMGMELSFGKARPGIGGGICQIANMINWLVLHSDLSIKEKSQHSFDPFPDEGRILPFGTGAAIFYNYIDYQFTNHTANTYQILLHITEKNLVGELKSLQIPENSYHIVEKNHAFHQDNDHYYRKNEIWRQSINRKTGNANEEVLMYKNCARVAYTPPAAG